MKADRVSAGNSRQQLLPTLRFGKAHVDAPAVAGTDVLLHEMDRLLAGTLTDLPE